MYEAIISACQALDAFGLPRAVGRFDADRFVFANNSFLQATGLEKDEIRGLALSGVVKIHLSSPAAAQAGRLAPVTVRSQQKRLTISGHAAFDDHGLVFIMLASPNEPNVEFESAMAVRRERERQQIAGYVHEYIAPELLSAVFSIESIRLELEDKEAPTAAELKELGDRLTKLIEPVFRGS
ncbi:MAG TPA: hypothetical protein VF020_03250 [Chthoniobacterales bacterium]